MDLERRHVLVRVPSGPPTGSAYSSVDHSLRILPVPSLAYKSVVNRCIGERRGGGLRYAHLDVTDQFKVWDRQLLDTGADGDGAQWAVVHQIGVVEMMRRNPEAAAVMRARAWLGVEKSMELNILFSLLSFTPSTLPTTTSSSSAWPGPWPPTPSSTAPMLHEWLW
ncbi:hypothetical protein ACP70R_037701 [Stipagrostis hirtigluma subsp. patula]